MNDLSLKGVVRHHLGMTGDFTTGDITEWVDAWMAPASESLRENLERLARREHAHDTIFLPTSLQKKMTTS